MRRKAFIFSIDALFAAILVIILASLFTAPNSFREGKTQAYELIGANASDAAAVGFYIKEDAAYFGLNTSILVGSEIGKCAVIYIYDPDNGSSQATIGTGITEKKFCKGIS